MISGDFNHVSLSSHLTGFKQFNCLTRQNKTLNLLYANVKDAYRATAVTTNGQVRSQLGCTEAVWDNPHSKEKMDTLGQ